MNHFAHIAVKCFVTMKANSSLSVLRSEAYPGLLMHFFQKFSFCEEYIRSELYPASH